MFRSKIDNLIAMAVLPLLIAVGLHAGAPQLVSYQGRLTNALGQIVPDGPYNLNFRIYDAPTVGNVVWDETHNGVPVSGGIFNIVLGSVKNPSPFLDASMFSDTSRWLGITVGADPEISPRTRLTSVPYAFRVATIDNSTGGTVDGDLTLTGKATIGLNTNTGFASFVAGEDNNAIGDYATIGGGDGHTASGLASVIAGGGGAPFGMAGNIASGEVSTVSGGAVNVASGEYSAVGGGLVNTASGRYSTVTGGTMNRAQGDYSVAAGNRAKADHHGSFVWADQTAADFSTTATNQFLIRASGGVGIGTNSPAATLDVSGNTRTTGFQMYTGAVSGYVLTSDAFGTSTWQAVTNSSGWIDDGAVVSLLNGSDNVGIGTASPTEKLDVVGNVHASGNLVSGNSIIIDGTQNKIFASGSKLSFDDDTLWTTGTVVLNSTSNPLNSQCLNAGKAVNTSSMVEGIGVSLVNSGSGSVTGLRATGNSMASGFAYGVYATAVSDGPIREGVYGSASSSSVTGSSVGLSGQGYGGALSIGVNANGYSGVTGYGVEGIAGSNSGSGYGVRGVALSNAGTGIGVYGSAASNGTNIAGLFSGNVNVTGTLSKGGGAFKIDHPLDPENKYLQHSFVESPDMMNIYNGNVTTDAKGEAVVELPTYFEALNRDFRYQLTVIGKFAQAIVAQEIANGRFTIKTDKPNVKVSWHVTGIRKDAFAEANRIQVELDKGSDDKGKYLYPKAYNLGDERGVDYKHVRADKDARISSASEKH